jgi:TonB family protein
MSIIAIILAAQSAAPAFPAPGPPPPVSLPGQPPAAGTGPTPLGNPGTWATTADYPTEALREEVEGIVGFRLNIDAGGVPTGCEVVSTSGSLLLDATTCALVQIRARFRPGRDAKGKPQVGTYSGRVRWVIPRDDTFGPRDAAFTEDGRPRAFVSRIKFIIETDGSISNCVIESQDATRELTEPVGPCNPSQPYKPLLDAAGKPARKQVIYTMSAEIVDPPKP